ncbi:hydroxymethylglutaryl-CoA lyase [Marinibaculum pumilum]|uniref:Hydroxymethylglutaryl-CoA lyase n=1 Tax=Marinibaculum pumilum TaxID=1766165 RepID=A0ABV7KYX9_9PROT
MSISGLPKQVTIWEAGPRDGLQNEPGTVPTAVKVELIERLVDAGVSHLETTSFVSPKWVPQMADNAQVMAQIRRRPGIHYQVLVPNMKGFEAAMAAGAEEIGIFTAASESFCRRNTNCSIAESLERLRPVCEAALARGVKVRAFVSCIAGCPFEGEIAPAKVAEVTAALAAMGAYEVALGDTIGVGTPGKVRAAVEACAAQVPLEKIAVHCHDTYGQALANILAALEVGVASIDSSVGGLGGCPYAPGATGNVATDDVVYMLDGLGVETGIDLEKLVQTSWFISDALGRPPASNVARAMKAKCAA